MEIFEYNSWKTKISCLPRNVPIFDGAGGQPFRNQPSMVLLDVGNNTAIFASEVVTCSILSAQGNISTASLLGNTSIAAVSGIVLFRDLGIDRTGVYILRFSVPNILSVVSGSVSVDVGSGCALKLDQRPLSISGGDAFPLNITVSIIDRGANLVVNDRTNIKAHLFQDGQDRILGGGNTVQSMLGVALFIDLFVNASGLGYFIQFTAPDLMAVLSPTFSVTVGPAHTLQLVSAPNTNYVGLPFDGSVVIYAEDKGGNKQICNDQSESKQSANGYSTAQVCRESVGSYHRGTRSV